MNDTKVWLAGVIGVSSVVAVVAVGLSVVQEQAQSGSIVGSQMITGATTVESSRTLQIPLAVPRSRTRTTSPGRARPTGVGVLRLRVDCAA